MTFVGFDSALGGTPKRVAYYATFFAGGDSLFSLREWHRIDAKDKWMLMSGLDGVPRDSIRFGGAGDILAFFGAVPGSKWLALGLYPQ